MIKLYELITGNKEHSAARTAFFLDQDFDAIESLPNARNVYVTPCYSVENAITLRDSGSNRACTVDHGAEPRVLVF